jgi:hypothetical protein
VKRYGQEFAYQRPIWGAERMRDGKEEAQTPKAGCISLATHVNQNNIAENRQLAIVHQLRWALSPIMTPRE